MPPADVLRLIDAAFALVLVPICGWCMVTARCWDQRLRFLGLGSYAVIDVGAQLNALGDPLNWKIPALLVATLISLFGTGWYVVRDRREP